MARRIVGRRRVIVALIALGMCAGTVPAHARTVWTLAPAPNHVLWIGVTQSGAFNVASLTVPSAATVQAQQWVFTRSGGTIQYPLYRISNNASGKCLGGPGSEFSTAGPHVPVYVGQCYLSGIQDWQFRTLTNQVGNPGLSSNRLWRIHTRSPRAGGDFCLVVPYSSFNAGTKLGLQRCGQASNHQWWLSRATVP